MDLLRYGCAVSLLSLAPILTSQAATVSLEGAFPSEQTALDACSSKVPSGQDCRSVAATQDGASLDRVWFWQFIDNSSGLVYRRFLYCRNGQPIAKASEGWGYAGVTCLTENASVLPPTTRKMFFAPDAAAFEAMDSDDFSFCDSDGYEWQNASSIEGGGISSIRLGTGPDAHGAVVFRPTGGICLNDSDLNKATTADVFKATTNVGTDEKPTILSLTGSDEGTFAVDGEQFGPTVDGCQGTTGRATVCNGDAADSERPTGSDGQPRTPDWNVTTSHGSGSSGGTTRSTFDGYNPTATADTNGSGGSSDEPTAGEGDTQQPNGDEDASGGETDQPGAGDWLGEVPTYGESFARLKQAATQPGSPLGVFDALAVNGSSAPCPAPSFEALGETFRFDGHCTVASDYRSYIRAIFLIVWTLTAATIVVKV